MEQPFPEKLNVAMIQVRRRRLLQLAGQSGEGFGSWRVRKELEQGALLDDRFGHARVMWHGTEIVQGQAVQEMIGNAANFGEDCLAGSVILDGVSQDFEMAFVMTCRGS